MVKQRARTCPIPEPRKRALALRPPSTPTLPATPAETKGQAQQDVFMREVDDALREDQLLDVWQRWGKLIVAVILVGLAALAGWLWYGENRDGVADAAGEKLIVALDQVEAGQLDAGAAALAPLSAEGPGGARVAATMMRAGILAEQGKAGEAVKLFAAVAADGDAPGPYRDLAKIREVALSFDTLPPEQVIARLKPLAVPGNAWFGSAGELVGAAYLKQNRTDLAGPLFAAIAKDEGVPQTIRSRTRQLAGLLGVDAVTDPEAAAGLSPVAQAPAQ